METFINPPKHFGFRDCNKELLWHTTDSQELYNQHLQDPVTRDLLEKNNWINSTIYYKFNSHGFRTPEFEIKRNFIVLGCSLTQGTGLNESQTWPVLVSQKLDIDVWNLSIAGTASDTCYRIARYYLPVLKPEFVVMLEPELSRIEIFVSDKNSQPDLVKIGNNNQLHYLNNHWMKTWVANEYNMELHSEKNVNSIAFICKKLGIDFYYYSDRWFKDQICSRHFGRARDLQHPGKENNKEFSEIVIQDIVNKNIYE